MVINAVDVADYILEKLAPISAMKLQKLVYYSQAWHLVWEDSPLFEDEIQAWANGPVVVDLYKKHQGVFSLEHGFFLGDISRIPAASRDVVDRVLNFYGNKDAQWLSSLTRCEAPWKQARIGLSDGERGSNIISLASMAEYYGSL